MGDETRGKEGRGRQQENGGSKGQGGAAREKIGDSKWCMPGLSVDPGGARATLAVGRGTVKAVPPQEVASHR